MTPPEPDARDDAASTKETAGGEPASGAAAHDPRTAVGQGREPKASATEIVREVQGARDRLNAAIEQSRRLRSALEARPVRSGVYPSTSPDRRWVLLVGEHADRCRRLFLQLLGGGLNVDRAKHAGEIASLAPLRSWAALVVDGSGGDSTVRAVIRVARSQPRLATVPIVLAHDGLVPAEVRGACAAVVKEWAGEDVANVVKAILRTNLPR
jgi:hypothetical protein